jgi:uncharacterized protein
MQTAWRIVDANSGCTVVESLELADGYWSRLVGWQFRQPPGPQHGLLLVPCSSVHTCFVRFSVDVILLECKGRVVAIRKNVRPWRLVLPVPMAHAVLEVPAGGPDFHVGQQLAAAAPDGGELPLSLQFLRAMGSPAATSAPKGGLR